MALIKKAIHTGNVLGPYSPAVEISCALDQISSSTKQDSASPRIPATLYISGQIPLTEEGIIVGQDFASQIRQVFENIKNILDQAQYQMSDLVKITIYLTDLGNFSLVNEACQTYLSDPYPARATLQVSALPKGALVEIEAVAAK